MSRLMRIPFQMPARDSRRCDVAGLGLNRIDPLATAKSTVAQRLNVSRATINAMRRRMRNQTGQQPSLTGPEAAA
jgi:hypothetical protein